MNSLDPTTTTINKIYPSVEDLSCINRSVACTEPGCSAIFKSTSNLTLHLAKTHRKADLLLKQSSTAAATINEYHCPVAACTYSKGSAAFKRLKLLKQHYLKVHCARAYACTALCGQSFATESYRDKHSEYCHVSFRCCDCANFYASYDTLRTHSRRKRHKILNKIDYKVTPLLMLNKLNKITQTVLPPPQHQQVVTVAQTQTIENERVVEAVLSGGEHNNASQIRSKSIKTQTTIIPSRSTSCNTSFNLNDFEFTIDDNDDLQRRQSSISTQTHRNLNNNNNQGLLLPPPTITPPPPPPQIDNDLDDDDSSFFSSISVANSSNNNTSRTTNCCASNNTESQTDGNLLLFDDNYCDYYTNMYTQTCDDMLLSEIGFHNIETQTMFDDVLRSVESQTVMSLHHCSGGGNTAMRMNNSLSSSPMLCSISSISNGKDTSHMETQTDLEFKQMLEEINA